MVQKTLGLAIAADTGHVAKALRSMSGKRGPQATPSLVIGTLRLSISNPYKSRESHQASAFSFA